MEHINKNKIIHSNVTPIKTIYAIGSILFFSLSWYLSNGVKGDFWYLTWLAPVSIILIALNTTAKTTFFVALLASLLGRLSYFFYLVAVSSTTAAIIITLLLSIVFALIMLLTRSFVLKANNWYSIFSLPALFTAFEFLMMKFSADGTSSSIAYSQSDCLPVIQIAAISGISGITFFIMLIPSAIAIGWYYRKQKKTLWIILFITVAFAAGVFAFSVIRLNQSSERTTIKAGLVVLDEHFHNALLHPDFEKEKFITASYVSQIAKLAAKGATLVVIPEKAININKETAAAIIDTLRSTAKQNHIFIIAGYVNYRNRKEYNSALVINAEGDTVVDYNKVYLVNGWENRFAKGIKTGLYEVLNTTAGIAICKDMDFPDYVRRYGKTGVALMTIPAWDFVVDDWLHSRMSIIRGVENGFSEIRTAREGRLTISDCYGRVTAEAISSNDKEAVLIGNVPLQKVNTIYDAFGDWVGIVSLLLSAWIVVVSIKPKHKRP